MARPKIEWPKVRERIYPSGKRAWMVDCGVANGRRLKFVFKTKAAADTKADQFRVARANEGVSAFGLAREDRADAEAALAVLKPHGATLKAAAEFYVANIETVTEGKTPSEVASELLRIKEQ